MSLLLMLIIPQELSTVGMDFPKAVSARIYEVPECVEPHEVFWGQFAKKCRVLQYDKRHVVFLF